MNLYSAYDYLAFVIPGGIVLLQFTVGVGHAIGDPGAGAILLLLAAAFLVGHAVAAIASRLQPLAWGHRPGRPPDPLWGLGGGRPYSAEEITGLKQELEARYGTGLTLLRLYQLAYTEIQHVGKDARLVTINSQIAFYRNAAVGLLIAAGLALVLQVTGRSTIDAWLTVPVYVFGAALFLDRYRAFWSQFADNVVRGFRILAREEATRPSS